MEIAVVLSDDELDSSFRERLKNCLPKAIINQPKFLELHNRRIFPRNSEAGHQPARQELFSLRTMTTGGDFRFRQVGRSESLLLSLPGASQLTAQMS